MVPASQDRLPNRQATLEAACRVALRMVRTGRGRDSALQFLVDVAGRLFDGSAEIVVAPIPGVEACPVPVRPQEALVVEGQENCWSVPIRSEAGDGIGELRLCLAASGRADEAHSKALETIAQGAASIIAHAERSAQATQSP